MKLKNMIHIAVGQGNKGEETDDNNKISGGLVPALSYWLSMAYGR
jgi:hypothetical protein